jgi:hypothetical protein
MGEVFSAYISVVNPASSDNTDLFFGPNTDGIDIDSSRRVPTPKVCTS